MGRKQSHRFMDLFSVYFVGQMIERLLLFFLIPIYTALFLPNEFGMITLLVVTVGLLSAVVSLPLSAAVIRFYHSPAHIKKRGIFICNLIILAIIQSNVLSVIFIVLAPFVAQVLFADTDLIPLVWIFSGVLFLTPFSNVFQSILKMDEQANHIVIISIIKQIIRIGTIIIFFKIFHLGIYSLAFGELLGLIWECFGYLPKVIQRISWKADFQILKEPLKYSYPMILNGYAVQIVENSDRYILRFFGHLGSVGIYSIAYQFSTVINAFLGNPLKMAITPLIAKLENSPKKLKLFVRSVSTYYYLIASSIWLVLSIYSGDVLSILVQNEEYEKGIIIIPVVMFSFVLHGMGSITGWGLMLKKKSFHISFIVVVAAIVNIVFNLILVPSYGLLGAAIGTLAAYGIWNLLKMYYSKRFYGFNFDYVKMIHITFIALLCYFLSWHVNSENILWDILLKMFVIVVYVFYVLYGPLFDKKETKAFLGFIKDMISRIKPAYKKIYK